MGVKVVVTGGKGGTGKSFIATNLALVMSNYLPTYLADLDVENPNDYILLNVELSNCFNAYIPYPVIDYSRCSACGKCTEVCDTGAVVASRGKPPFVIPRLCSGCRACILACPNSAIREGKRSLGKVCIGKNDNVGNGLTVVTGILNEGEEHVAPLVLITKSYVLNLIEGRKEYALITDTSAGTSINVALACRGNDVAVVVTEPTPLGIHDLRMILEVLSKLGIQSLVVINKVGVSDSKYVELINELSGKYLAKVVAKVPYSKEVIKSYMESQPIVLRNPNHSISKSIRKLGLELLKISGD